MSPRHKRFAIFVLEDREGRVLLQHKAREPPKAWALFGGGIRNGETPLQAVKREAREELGLDPRFRFFGRYEVKEEGSLNEKFLFIAPMEGRLEELKKRQKTGDGLGLFGYEDIRLFDLKEGTKVILKDLFRETLRTGILEVKKKSNPEAA